MCAPCYIIHNNGFHKALNPFLFFVPSFAYHKNNTFILLSKTWWKTTCSFIGFIIVSKSFFYLSFHIHILICDLFNSIRQSIIQLFFNSCKEKQELHKTQNNSNWIVNLYSSNSTNASALHPSELKYEWLPFEI